MCVFLFFHSLLLKCSVSCGTGIQVRKIECIAGESSNINDKNDSRIGENRNGNNSIGGSGDDGPGVTMLNTATITECELSTKPAERQSCTTGITCSNTDDETEDESEEHEQISSEVFLPNKINNSFPKYCILHLLVDFKLLNQILMPEFLFFLHL